MRVDVPVERGLHAWSKWRPIRRVKGSELIFSGDIVCEVACSCEDRRDGSRTTGCGKFMVQGREKIVGKQRVPYTSR